MEEQKQVNLNDTKCGYLVALNQEGGLDFEIFGQEHGIVELKGLHALAGERIQQLNDRAQGYGFPAVFQALEQLVQNLNAILGKIPSLKVADEPVAVEEEKAPE